MLAKYSLIPVPCSLQVEKLNLVIEYPVSLQIVILAIMPYEKKNADRQL